MNGFEYQKLASRTIRDGMSKSDMLNHGVFGLCSEAGEVASIMQHTYQGKPLEINALCDELGDALWFAAEVCTAVGIRLDDVMTHNIEKLRKRYPEGFDEYRSEHRHEVDEE